MSQEELSEQAGLGLKYINQLENQNVNLTIHSLESDCRLKMTPEEFFNFDSLESTSDKTDNLSLKNQHEDQTAPLLINGKRCWSF